MAEFAAISYDMQERDDEFLSLTPDERHIWLALLATRWPRPGIFKGGIAALMFATGREKVIVADAMARFGELGWIERDGDWTWIVNWIEHRSHNSNWRSGAEADVRSLLDKTPLALRCCQRYAIPTEPDAVATRSRRRADAGTKQSKEQQSKEQQRKEPPSPQGGDGACAPVAGLDELESRLKGEAAAAWLELKQAMQRRRKGRVMSDNVPRKFLADCIAAIEKHGFSMAQVVYGFQACIRAEDGPAEVETYFRKAALNYRPDAPRTTQPQSTNMLDRAYDPTRSTVPGFKEVKL